MSCDVETSPRADRPHAGTNRRRPPVVCFTFPAHGHINPILPVIREMIGRGQPVVCFSTERFRHPIISAGAQFRSYGTRFRMPERGPGPFARVSSTLEALLTLTCAVLNSDLEDVRALGAAHILHDSFAPWGSLAAQLLHLPAIAYIPSILVNREIDGYYGNTSNALPSDPVLTARWVARFRLRCDTALSRYGLRPLPSSAQLLQSYGDRNVVFTSHAFQPMANAFDDRRFRFVGPCFEPRSHESRFPADASDGRPMILISLGTVYTNVEFLRRVLEELREAPWRIVLSTGGQFDPALLGRAPPNFLIRSFVPQIELLSRSAAFLSHGGMNSVQEAFYHSVPMAITPQGADQFWISARARELGAALVLDPAHTGPGRIRAALAEILENSSYRRAAGRIGESLRSAGGAPRAAEEILRFLHVGSN